MTDMPSVQPQVTCYAARLLQPEHRCLGQQAYTQLSLLLNHLTYTLSVDFPNESDANVNFPEECNTNVKP